MEFKYFMSKLRIIRFALVVLLCSVLLSIYGCSKTKEKYEKNDPKLHGQVVHFNKEPVAYMLLSHEKDAGKYDDESIKIGRRLVDKSLVSDPYTSFGQRPSEDIREGMSFTIISSYWVRHNWLRREFASDYRNLVLKDENGVLSSCSFNMLIFSDREDLLK